jgi:hypothetical protein
MKQNEKETDNTNVKDEFLVKITGPGLALERSVPAERVHYIVSLLLQPKATLPSIGEISSQQPIGVVGAPSAEISSKQFMAEKRPKTDMQRVACLAFYLTHYRNIQFFKTRDLTDLNKEAAQPQMSNPTVAVRNATNQQYLAIAGGGSKQITTRGEEMVKALPDHEKVKVALENNPLARRKRNTNATNKK